MAKIKINEISENIRPAVHFTSLFSDFGNDYLSIINSTYRNEMFLYDLSAALEGKKYKQILHLLREEYGPSEERPVEINIGGAITEDEKLVRQTLRRDFSYGDADFFNPRFDKKDLVVWEDPRDGKERLFRVESCFIDGGAYYYNLRDIESGVNVGGRLRQDELKEPSAPEYANYYKEKGMFDVYLFNKFFPLDKVPLDKKLIMLDALKGIDYEHKYDDVHELAYATQQGLIDANSHFNVLAMLADSSKFENAPITLKLSKESASAEEIIELETKARESIHIIEKYRGLVESLKNLKNEMSSYLKLNPEDENVKNIYKKLLTVDQGYNSIKESDLGAVYGSAANKLQKQHSGFFNKIDTLYSQTIFFVQERDVYKLNRPDLSKLIKDAGLVRDLSREDKVLFRGMSRNDKFEFHNSKGNFEKAIKDDVVELDVANNGYRREFIQTPGENRAGSKLGYCEGDLVLTVPRNRAEFDDMLDSAIKFYLEDEGIFSPEKMIEIRDEVRLHLKVDEVKINSDVAVMSPDSINKEMGDIVARADRSIDLIQK